MKKDSFAVEYRVGLTLRDFSNSHRQRIEEFETPERLLESKKFETKYKVGGRSL